MARVKITIPENLLESLAEEAKQHYRTVPQQILWRLSLQVTPNGHLGTTAVPSGATDVPSGDTKGPRMSTQGTPTDHLGAVLEADASEDKDTKVRVLLEVWTELFPNQTVTPLGMSKLFELAEGTAEFVYEQLSAVATQPGVRNPYGYAQKLIKTAVQERKKPKMIVGPGGVILHEQTEEERRADEEAKRILIELGEWQEGDEQWVE